jgi:alkylated DNA repair dioxygenase AlkB
VVAVTVAAWQPSLLGDGVEVGFDAGFSGAARRHLDGGAWVDAMPGWVTGGDLLFDEVLAAAPWAHHDRWMYERMVAEPRLTTHVWDAAPQVLHEMGRALSERYGLELPVISANLYRDGDDSVAWHGDRIGRVRDETVVAMLSLGSPRRFLLRPKKGGGGAARAQGGGASVRFVPASGDVLVLGGTCQRTWEHCVPKCASAGPRISVMWREGY